MKGLHLKLFVASMLCIFLSCGNDDEKEQRFFTGDCKQEISLESGPANSPITTALVVSPLDDMLEGSTGSGPGISSGELLVTGNNTAVKVTGLPAGTVLKDFKLSINGIEQDFGDVSNERANLNLYTDSYSGFFGKAFTKMVSDRKLETKISFTPTVRTGENVHLEIVFSGRFSYWTKI